MASLNSIFDSVGRATSTPRVYVNPSQGARSKLLSRSRQSTSPPVERVSESEREHINTQISDLEKALQDLTSDYQRCRAELEQTIRRRRHISFGNISGVHEQVRETETPLASATEMNESRAPAQINLAQSERNERAQDGLETTLSSFPSDNSNRHRLRKEKEPDKFDGKSVAWQDYLVHFEQVSLWNKWSYEEMSQQLIMSLRGEAQRILGDLSQSQLKDYNSLRSILASRFCPQERTVAYRVEFRSRSRKSGETPSDYGYALRRLGNLAFPDMSYSNREIIIVEQFMNGIGNSDIRSHVILHHPNTLESAISSATEFEAIKGPQLSITKPYVSSVQSSEVKSPDELLSAIKSLEISINKLSNRHRGGLSQSGKAVKCYNCKMLGHIAKYCKAPNTYVPLNEDQNNTNSASTQSVNAQEN